MNAKQLLRVTALAVAMSPLAAFAESDISAREQAWLASLQSTVTVADVRAQIEPSVAFGDLHPVELQRATSTQTRDEVKRELATFGPADVEA
jgi:hypothetical protein